MKILHCYYSRTVAPKDQSLCPGWNSECCPAPFGSAWLPSGRAAAAASLVCEAVRASLVPFSASFLVLLFSDEHLCCVFLYLSKFYPKVFRRVKRTEIAGSCSCLGNFKLSKNFVLSFFWGCSVEGEERGRNVSSHLVCSWVLRFLLQFSSSGVLSPSVLWRYNS